MEIKNHNDAGKNRGVAKQKWLDNLGDGNSPQSDVGTSRGIVKQRLLDTLEDQNSQTMSVRVKAEEL